MLTMWQVTFLLGIWLAALSFLGTVRKEEITIAIYHLSIKIISRGKGKSAVAAAAYRAGEKITNQYDGVIHDYTRKSGIAHTEILLPDNAPREYADRATLWNAVEQIEKNKNAQLSREIEIALPVELSAGQNISLVREYCQQHFVSKGMCADICVHDKNDGKPHAHIMLTMRPMEQDGSWGAKSKKEYILDENGERIHLKSGAFKTRKVDATDWNNRENAEIWRQGWADICNRYLEQQGVTERIDHRSYERQGIEQIPTVHLGVAAFQMEKRGIQTDRGDMNRRIAVDNKMLRQLRARINKLKKGLDGLLAEEKATATPSLADVLTGILEKPEEKTRRQRIGNIKTVAKSVAFLQTNGITTLPELRQYVIDLQEQNSDNNEKIKKVERRLDTLSEHIKQAEIYRQHRGVYQQYKQQKPKNIDAFFELHSAETILFEAAERYLKAHLNGRGKIPLSAWKSEAASLTVEEDRLYQEYYHIKDTVKEVENIQRCVEQAVLQPNNDKDTNRQVGNER